MNIATAKIVLAFAGGAAIASGLFVWTSRETRTAPQPAEHQPATQATVPEPAPEPVVEPPPVQPIPAPVKRAAAPKPKPRVLPSLQPARATPSPATQPPATQSPASQSAATRPQAPEPAPEPPPVAQVHAPEPLPETVATTEPAPLPPPPAQTVTLKQGTLLSVRLGEGLASDRNQPGDTFRASLDEPLVIDGWVIAERGARVLGRIRDMEQSGRVKGLASMTLELVSLDAADGQRIDLRTAGFVHKARESKKNDAVKVGIGAAIGAALGAAIGGGKGAAIGAASGGAAGAGAVAATRGDAAVLDPETRIRFRVDRSVEITERR